MKRCYIQLICLAAMFVSLRGKGEPATGIVELTTPESCLEVLDHQDTKLRRAAFARLLDMPELREKTIQQGLNSTDALIRHRSLLEYFMLNGEKALPRMTKMVDDPDSMVQSLLIDCASRLLPAPEARAVIVEAGKASNDSEIRRKANRLTNAFSMFRQKQRLVDNPSFDYNINTVKSIRIPEKNWRFRIDPEETGHIKEFFSENIDDSDWAQLKMGFWEHQGFPDFDGIAWYRIRFTMPEKIDHSAVELSFSGVDEEAWVWLNGIYIGQHILGPAGWNIPFQLDVTSEIRWKGENILVVRVADSNGVGGIYKPVTVEILK